MRQSQLTRRRLRTLLTYDPHTGEFLWRIPRQGIACGNIAGSMRKDRYIRINLDYRDYYAHRLVWLYMFGRWPRAQIDHVNGDPADNRLVNLREATHSQNMQHSKKQSNGKAKYKGITWHKAASKWAAHISCNGQSIYLGVFEKPEDAHLAYCKAARELHGRFARTY